MTAKQVERARDDEASLDEQHAAFAELVSRFNAMAFSMALRSLNDADEARDATQDAFLEAWRMLRSLREPAAFGGWLKQLVRTQCSRRLRRRELDLPEQPPDDAAVLHERRRLLARSMRLLTTSEYRAVVLFYFFGSTIREIASSLRVSTATAGKRLYTARLKMRRSLPRSVRDEFVRRRPAGEFAARIRRGIFDQYVGTYRFDRRPDLIVRIERCGGRLVSDGGGQRHLLASIDDEALIAAAFDGEGRFRRDRRGRVTHFIYYEFGKRLGIARKIGD